MALGDRPLVLPEPVALMSMALMLFVVHAWQFPETLVRVGSDTLLAAKFARDPSLIPNSLYHPFIANTPTLAQAVPGWLARLGAAPYLIELGLMLLTIVFAVTGMYLLATGLWRDRLAGIVAVILVTETQFQNLGTSQRFAVGHAPLVQYIGLAGAVVVLGLWARGWSRAAWLAAGLLFDLHAVHAVVVALILALATVLGRDRRLGEIVSGGALFALGSLPLVAYVLLVQWPQGLGPAARATVPLDEWWRLMIVRKYSVVFPFMGSGRQWAFVTIFALAGAVAWRRLLAGAPGADPAIWRARLLPVASAIVVVALCAVGTVFVALVPVRTIASLALYRTVPYVLVIAAVCIAKVLVDLLSSGDLARRGLAIGCLVMAMLGDEPGIMLLVSLVVLATVTDRAWRRAWVAAIGLGALLSFAAHALQAVRPDVLAASRAAWIVSRFDVSQRVWPFYAAAVIVLLARRVADLGTVGAFAWTPLRRTACFTALFLLGLYPVAYALPDFKRTGTEADWLEVQKWARAQTPKGTVFVTPPNQWGFELVSERGQIISVYEMGLSIYVPAIFPIEIERTRDYGVDPLSTSVRGKLELGRALTASYERFTEADFLRLARKHEATYAIVDGGRSLAFEPVFHNGRFKVYRLPVKRAG